MRMKGLKQSGLALFLAAGMVGITACSGGGTQPPADNAATTAGQETVKAETKAEAAASAEKEPVEISFVNWGSVEASTKDAFENMIKDFEEKNPDIKINNVSFPYNQMLDQLLVMNAGGTPPDVAQLNGVWVSALNNAGALASMDDLLPKESLNDFLSSTTEGLRYDGKLKAVCWSPSPVALYYNRILLDKAGITEIPKTYDELFAAAEKVSALGTDENGNRIYGLGIQSQKLFGAGFYYLPYIWAEGGNLTDDAGTVTLDTPEVISALGKTQNLMVNEISPAGLEIKDLRNLFSQGYVGFHVDGDMGYPTFLTLSPKGEAFKDDIGIAPLPDSTEFFVEHDLVIFEKSEKKEAAARFVDYLSGPEGMTVYNDNGGNKSPARQTVAELDYYKLPENAHMATFAGYMEQARALPAQNPGFVKAMEEIAEAVQRVGINKEDPAKVAAELNQKVDIIYKQ